jgi:hypothetical protein
VAWACLLNKHFDVVHRRPRLVLVIVCSDRGEPHIRAAYLTIVVVGNGRGPLKVLLAPLFTAIDALLGVLGGDVRRCVPDGARGHLPASLGRAKHDRLVASGVLCGDATRLLKCVPEEVTISALSRALRAALG